MNGSKDFEFRRSAISPDVSHIIVYASSPTKKVLGVFGVSSVNVDCPESTWERTKSRAGISKDDFMAYFGDRERAYCIEINKNALVRFENEVSPLDVDSRFKIPQSFRYVDSDFLFNLAAKGFGI